MTKFADQLFNDLMREHGPLLASTKVPAAPKRYLTARPVLLTAGAGGLAVAATVGTLVAGGGTPAYAVTTHPDGRVSLAVYQQSGIAQANARLHALGDRVVVVPVRSGCPSITSLPTAAVPASGISVQASASSDGSVTVAAQGVPAGDILVLGVTTTASGQFSMQGTTSTASGQSSGSSGSASGKVYQPEGGQASAAASKLTSGPVPSCVSIPPTSLSPSGATGATTGGIAGGSLSCAHSPVPVGSLPANAQRTGRPAKPGAQASISCSLASGNASSGATSARGGSSTHSND
jgi:hypothetical protein